MKNNLRGGLHPLDDKNNYSNEKIKVIRVVDILVGLLILFSTLLISMIFIETTDKVIDNGITLLLIRTLLSLIVAASGVAGAYVFNLIRRKIASNSTSSNSIDENN